MARVAIGIDLGGTKILGGIVDSEGRILAERRRPTPAQEGPEAVLMAVRAVVDELLAVTKKAPDGDPLEVIGLGLGIPGPVDAERGISRFSPNLPGFSNTPILPAFADLGLPLAMQNDVRCHAWGERCFGAGRSIDDLLLVTIGTGIGSGIILGGKLYTGGSGMAGEIGHIQLVTDGPLCGCGNRGCLEAIASGPAIGRRAQAAGLGASARALFDRAHAGDPEAGALLEEIAADLGRGLATAVNILNPGRLLLGGGVVAVGELLLGPVRRHYEAALMPVVRGYCPLLPAHLVEEAGVVGAAALHLATATVRS
jgi:glucokinase